MFLNKFLMCCFNFLIFVMLVGVIKIVLLFVIVFNMLFFLFNELSR